MLQISDFTDLTNKKCNVLVFSRLIWIFSMLHFCTLFYQISLEKKNRGKGKLNIFV